LKDRFALAFAQANRLIETAYAIVERTWNLLQEWQPNMGY